MYSDSPDYVKSVQDNARYISDALCMPPSHVNYLKRLKDEYNFEPVVCYDIGAAVLHWCKEVEKIWPSTEVILFDAFEGVRCLYNNHRHYIGVLSDVDNREVKFYQNDIFIGGNSYYRELENSNGNFFPKDQYLMKSTRSLDSLVKEYNYPLPDLVKIDVQGAELDVINGGKETISNAKYLIVELQDVPYNEGAPLASQSLSYIESLGWTCIGPKFSDNGPDADYCFINNRFK